MLVSIFFLLLLREWLHDRELTVKANLGGLGDSLPDNVEKVDVYFKRNGREAKKYMISLKLYLTFFIQKN